MLRRRNRGKKKRRSLDRKYGFFHCKTCNVRWESSHVYCIPDTKKVLFKQQCKKCKAAYNPYRVEEIQCSLCGMEGDKCTCTDDEKKKRHIDKKKKHRQDLCMKCKAGFFCTSGVKTELRDTDDDD